MRLRWVLAAGVAALALGVGGAVATHVTQVDPTTVPVGFLATHSDVANFNVSSFARAAGHHDADVFVQHARIPAGGSTAWHTHPGPAIVTVVRGSLTYQDAHGQRCQSVTITRGRGSSILDSVTCTLPLQERTVPWTSTSPTSCRPAARRTSSSRIRRHPARSLGPREGLEAPPGPVFVAF